MYNKVVLEKMKKKKIGGWAWIFVTGKNQIQVKISFVF